MSDNRVPPIPPAQTSAQPPQKKSKWWLYGLLGCGGLIVVIVVVVVALSAYVWNKVPKSGAEMAAKMIELANPDVEVVKLDEATGRLTLKDKKTGKTTTISVEDAKEGRISFESEDSNQSMTIGAGAAAKLPSWVITYPGATAQGGLTGQGEDASGGSVSYTTTDSISQVIAFYKERLVAEGFQLKDEGQMTGTESFAMVAASTADDKRTVNVVANSVEGKTNIQLSYSERTE